MGVSAVPRVSLTAQNSCSMPTTTISGVKAKSQTSSRFKRVEMSSLLDGKDWHKSQCKRAAHLAMKELLEPSLQLTDQST